MKIDKKSLSAMCNPMEFACLDLREEVITGRTLSIVCGEVNTPPSANVSIVLAFCTTLKLYSSSRWRTLDPMNVKIGITFRRTASGARWARLEMRRRAWWKVWGLSET